MAERIDLVSAVPLPAPFTIFVEPTNVCNFRCGFCPVSLPDYAEQSGFYEHMGMELYGRVVEQIAEFGRIKALKLYFIGEPMLNPEITSMVTLAKARDLAERVEITTNGSVFDPHLITCGLDDLRVSIYAPGPTMITRHVRKWFELRERLQACAPRITLRYMPKSEEDEAKFRHTYAGITDVIQIEGLHSWSSTQGLVSIASLGRKRSCPLIHYMMVVKTNGDVVPCCTDWNAKLRLGNVKDETLHSIWHGTMHESLILSHLTGRRSEIEACAKCNMPDAYPDDVDSLTADAYLARRGRAAHGV